MSQGTFRWADIKTQNNNFRVPDMKTNIVEFDSDFVSLAGLAAELKIDRVTAIRYCRKHEIEFFRRRTRDSRRQLTFCLPRDEAERVKGLRRAEGFGV